MELGLSLSLAGQRQIPMSARVKAALKRYDAHLYIPGPGGVTVQSFQPGNYVESTGNTPGSVDGLVGLGLDVAGNVGPELVTDPGFDSASKWTVGYTAPGSASIAGSQAIINSPAGENASFETKPGDVAIAVGKTYEVTLDIASYSGSASLYAGAAIASIPSGTGKKTFRIQVANVSVGVKRSSPGVACYIAIESISIKELTGIHASQVTQGYKPYLRRGLVNLMTYSDDRSNTVWTKDGATASGSKLVESATTAQHRALNGTAVTLVADTARTYAAVVDPAERFIVRMSDNLALGATYNLSTGAITAVSGGVTTSMATLSNGRKLLVFSNTTSNTSGRLVFNLADGSGATTYSGDGASGVYLYSAALFQGTYTAQQILDAGGIPLTTNAPASSANGKFWWQFDGIDDKLTLTFPAGWESATIIDARATGQVTQMAQNIVGTYNISTSTYGRIFCRLSPSASDLALLQKFANILSGYVA